MSYNNKAFEIYKKHVEYYEKYFVNMKREARAKDWRPVRFACRDYILGYTVTRFNTMKNVIDVDVFESTDPDWLEGYSGTKVATLYVLSDAYKSGSSMGIQFTENVDKGFIPLSFCALAEETGVELKYVNKGFVTPKESRMLYLALTGFSPEAIKKIMELSVSNLIAPERICYLVNHGTWALMEMESILLGSKHPERLLNGKIKAEDYLKYAEIMSDGRLAVLGGILDNKMRLKEVYDGEIFVDVESNDREFDQSFDPRYWAKIYETKEETPIPWTKEKDSKVPANVKVVVVIRPYEWPDFSNNYEKDMEMLEEVVNNYGDEGVCYLLMLTRDISSYLDQDGVDNYIVVANDLGFEVMICPELIEQIDVDLQKRLQQMSVMRNDIVKTENMDVVEKPNTVPSFNEIEFNFISLPRQLGEGVVKLSHLIDQMLYDEMDLKNNVNRKTVEHRYHRTMDRIMYLAKIDKAVNKKIGLKLPGPILEEIIKSIEERLPENISSRLTKTVYPYPLLDGIIDDLKKYQGSLNGEVEKMILFLKGAKARQNDVVIFMNGHSKSATFDIQNNQTDEILENQFKRQFVSDRLIDYSNKEPFQIAEQIVWNAVNGTKKGTVNSANLSELPHMVIVEVLNQFLYYKAKDYDQPISINIIYTDGSQARPFPLFKLTRRTDREMVDLRQNKALEIGMMSCRHTSLDRIVGHYWIRNIEMKMAGKSGAEKDELSYQITKAKLNQILKSGKTVKINFYQTGFAPVVIGFYRAVAEFLIENKDSNPMLEVIPKIYSSRTKEYETSRKTWC